MLRLPPTPDTRMTPTPTTAAHVDLQRYLGIWYEIARKPMRHEDATARDITATYSFDESGAVCVVNACLNAEGEVEVSTGLATPIDASNARLEVSFLPEGLRWIPFAKGDYWILRVDDAYQTALVGDPDRKYLWLLHRQPKMDAASKAAWLEFARAQGYTLDDLVHPQQSGQVHRNPAGG